jgi:uncharacterized protein
VNKLGRQGELKAVLEKSRWFMAALADAAAVSAPEWWIGAGVIRDLVWDEQFGEGLDLTKVRDVDLVFFDPTDLSPARDQEVEAALQARAPAVPWDAKNQAAVHLWYPDRFGLAVGPIASISEAVATWPEFAACVAVTLSEHGDLQVLAPYGLDDLLDGVWRCNPKRVTREEYLRRLRRKDPVRRWPGVRVLGDTP